MNPLLFLFVFTYVFPHMSGGMGNPMAHPGAPNVSFSTVLLPGLMAVAIMFSGIAAVALPLAQDFGFTREIDDRVMCPLPVPLVAVEKIVFSAMQSFVAALIVYPLAIYIPQQPAQAHVTSWPFLILVVLLASLVSGALGLTLGTIVKPQQIGLIFGVVVVPITFLGCVYYPWAALNSLPILQHAILINPIVYMSEGLRSALTPSLGHMNNIGIIGMLIVFLGGLYYIGMRGFLRRVIS
jgi:ABC-2 type transport system permease protein